MEAENIVVIAMDGSKNAKHALKTYAEDFHKPNNRVIVVHVATFSDVSYSSATLIPGDPSLIQRIVEAEEEKCEQLMKQLKKELEVLKLPGDVIRVNGEAGHAVLEKAKELNAKYIVSGSRGLGQIRRTFMGSVSDYLVHHAHIPVVVCKLDHHQGDYDLQARRGTL